MATDPSELREALKETQEHLSEWRDDAYTAHRYYASDQWREIDKRAMEAEFRPARTVNLVKRLVDVITGNEVSNRFSTKYLPKTIESEDTAETVTSIVRSFKQAAHAEFEETAAFHDTAVCGVGCLEYHEGMTGELEVSRVPYTEIAWDPGAIRMNYDDAEWVMRGRWVPARQFREMFPDVDLDEVAISEFPGDTPFGGPTNDGDSSSNVFSPFYSARPSKNFDSRRNLVLLYELQKKAHEEYLEARDPVTGQTQEMSEEDYRRVVEVYLGNDLPVPAAETKIRRIIERSFWAGEEQLEDEIVMNAQPSYFFMTGFEDMEERTVLHRGLIYHLKEVQDIVNKGISKMLHILQTVPNNLLLTETGVFPNPKKAQKILSTTGGILEMNVGAITQKRYEFQTGQYPANFERLVGMFTSFFSEISGINPYVLGDVQDLRRVASSAVAQVQQQAMTILSVIFDALKKYRILSGYYMLDYIREEVPDQRIFNVVTAYGEQKAIQFNREAIRRGEYDIVVGEAPSTPTQMVEFWDTLTRSGGLDILLQTGTFTPLELVEIMPNIPNDLRDKIRQRLTAMMNQGPPVPGAEGSPSPPQAPGGGLPVQ